MRIVFVCNHHLEFKAALLAASLRHSLGSDVEITAAVPDLEERGGLRLSDEILRLFEALDVSRVSITQPFGSHYLIADKIAALGTGEVSSVLLDTDIVCLARPPLESLQKAEVAAKPTDVLNVYRDDRSGGMFSNFSERIAGPGCDPIAKHFRSARRFWPRPEH